LDYLSAVTVGTLLAFGLLYTCFSVSGVSRGRLLFTLTCILPSVGLCLYGVLELTILVPEVPANLTIEAIHDYRDLGPSSFARGMLFGIVPAAIYGILASTVYLLVEKINHA